MKGRALFCCAAALALVFAMGAHEAAFAKEKKEPSATTQPAGVKAIPKPSERRAGELEGWSDEGKKEKTVAAKKSKNAKSEKSTEKSGDGGLPLPSSRNDPNDYSPVGFDKNGNLSTGLKF